MTRAASRLALIILMLFAACCVIIGLSGCSSSDAETEGSATDSETEITEEIDDGPAGTYVGEFGATLDLEEYGSMDAMVPLTIEITEDGSAKAMWEYSTEVPMPEVDTAATAADLTGGLEGSKFGASGKGTLDLEGPEGSMNDSFGVVLEGELSYDNIIGTVEFYGETEEFVVTRQ